jgi:hypothetical protein
MADFLPTSLLYISILLVRPCSSCGIQRCCKRARISGLSVCLSQCLHQRTRMSPAADAQRGQVTACQQLNFLRYCAALQLLCGTDASILRPVHLHVLGRELPWEHTGNGCCGALGPCVVLFWYLVMVAAECAALSRRARRRFQSNASMAALDGSVRHQGSLSWSSC